MKKIDVHVHCAPAKRPAPRASSWDPEDCYIAAPAELREHREAQGIARALVLSGGEQAQADGLITNDEGREVVRQCPDFFGWMCNLTPEHPETVPERLARYKAQGAVGVGELAVNQWLDSPFLTQVFAAAEQLQLPVTIHMSPQPGYAYGVCDRPGLPLLEQVLQRFPNLKILGHSQVFWLEISGDCPREGNEARSRVGRGPVQPGGRVVQLLRRYPNLYGDLSAYSGSCAILRDEAHGLAFLEEFSSRLLFATDTVNRRQTYPLAAFLDTCRREGRLSEAAWENICFKNAARLFALDIPRA